MLRGVNPRLLVRHNVDAVPIVRRRRIEKAAIPLGVDMRGFIVGVGRKGGIEPAERGLSVSLTIRGQTVAIRIQHIAEIGERLMGVVVKNFEQ